MPETVENVIGKLEFFGCRVEPCGSRVTCNPAPTNTDQDYLVEIVADDKENVARIVNILSGDGFSWEGNEHYQDAAGHFMSWRRDDINFIVTAKAEFARRHRVATAVCKRLNLQDKQDRIALFQAVLYGNEWDGNSVAPRDPARDFSAQMADEVF